MRAQAALSASGISQEVPVIATPSRTAPCRPGRPTELMISAPRSGGGPTKPPSIGVADINFSTNSSHAAFRLDSTTDLPIMGTPKGQIASHRARRVWLTYAESRRGRADDPGR